MQEYVITREDLRRWCSIPLEKLEQQPNQKMKLILRERERDVAAEVGNLLAEEVIRNNRSHKPTRWILPGRARPAVRRFYGKGQPGKHQPEESAYFPYGYLARLAVPVVSSGKHKIFL